MTLSLRDLRASHGRPAREQYLAAQVAFLMSLLRGQLLLAIVSDLQPTMQQQYVRMVYDSDNATFRVAKEKLDKLKLELKEDVDGVELAFRTIQRIGAGA